MSVAVNEPVDIPADFIANNRTILSSFNDADFSFLKQEHEFKTWPNRSQYSALGSPGHTVTQNNATTETNTGLLDRSNPAAIEFELKDYKELFSKLKVTYLEQETKEAFLRIILEDDEEDGEEANGKELKLWKIGQKEIDEVTERNAELKAVLVDKKKSLQTTSDEISKLVEDICKRYETLKAEVTESEQLLLELEDMKKELQELEKSEEEPKESHETLSLKETNELYVGLKLQEMELDDDIKNLRDVSIPQKTQELERLTKELTDLTKLKSQLDEAAELAVKVRQSELKEGKLVEKENQARWYTEVYGIVCALFNIDDVQIDKAAEQVMVAGKDSKQRELEVNLMFTKGRFYNATISTSAPVDIKNAVDKAVKTNSVQVFMEELRATLDA
ncbi:hypothetical protein BZA70DRAFT_267613 [Myxozyma melibiosi]|uniref:Kinetochore protein Sos7 coiled-coil domain-containing protein n=1 Tax=Myxozyma melibiosi TaxID=54550 RepID=A0ABR1F5G6_9ASCO